jgi:hypothetical protein
MSQVPELEGRSDVQLDSSTRRISASRPWCLDRSRPLPRCAGTDRTGERVVCEVTARPRGNGHDVRRRPGRGRVVGGLGRKGFLGDTWTWDGATWTKQHPASSPRPSEDVGMAYDAARGDVVLFGGFDGSFFGQTWTWDGVTWTERHPAASPDSRSRMGLAYGRRPGRGPAVRRRQ